jgi:hypothetical protein
MKTALCLYGQPRDAQVKSQQIIDNVVKPNNCDVFFHAWYDNSDLSLHKMTPGHEHRSLSSEINYFLLNQYSPKSCIIEKQRKFHHRDFSITEENFSICYPWAAGYDRNSFIKDRGVCTHSMWYSIMQSILLKELYSHENDFTYDCVILSRFDVKPDRVINVNDYDLSTVTTRSFDYPRNEVCDWFLITNNDNINCIGNTFNLLNIFHNNIQKSNVKIWNNESFLRESLRLNCIKESKGNFDVTF